MLNWILAAWRRHRAAVLEAETIVVRRDEASIAHALALVDEPTLTAGLVPSGPDNFRGQVTRVVDGDASWLDTRP